ncbi:TetR/AcrR family transcriptional regulator [Glutamicibacter sp.]|uniref:TetR/AcrR family transcriptional regulator n=1 Tax=Glutamicibacter sp. TaxID=1931995 RepID=UPI0028BE4CE7|nr:TetR/AcrR family transcriptional regulator [Glutamicibacter sp.]
MINANRQQSTAQRPLRADAAKNKQIILDTASQLFARQGMEVTLEQIASEAGLGVGTVYRRFPTLDALIDELFGERFSQWAIRVKNLEAMGETDPWGAFEAYLYDLAEAQGCDAAFAQLLVEPLDGSCRFGELHAQTIRGAQRILALARDAEVVRADLDNEYLLHIQLAILGVAGVSSSLGSSAAKSLVKIVVAGCKPQPKDSPILPPPTLKERTCWQHLIQN